MPDLLANFGIDWKLLLAQVVNFFVLLVVLKKFAYRPVFNMLRRRETEIKRGLAASQESQDRLAHIKVAEEERLNQAHKEALEIITRAEAGAKTERETILAETEKKSEVLIADARGKISQERQVMLAEVEGQAINLLTLGVTKVLGRMAPEARDAHLIEETLRELKTVKIEE